MLPRMEGARAVAVVVAAGSGTRLGGDEPKALLTIGGRPMVAVAVERALTSPSIAGVVVAAPPGFEERVREALAPIAGSSVVVTGGETRQGSVAAGLNAVDAQVDVVVVHDAARPFASAELFTAVVDAVLAGADAAVPVLPLVDTVKRVRDGSIVGTEASRRAGARADAASVSHRAPPRRAREGRGVGTRFHGRRRSARVGGGNGPHRAGRAGELQDHDGPGPRPSRCDPRSRA